MGCGGILGRSCHLGLFSGLWLYSCLLRLVSWLRLRICCVVAGALSFLICSWLRFGFGLWVYAGSGFEVGLGWLRVCCCVIVFRLVFVG